MKEVEIAQKAAQGCYLVFQDGGFLGNNWIELQGNGVEEVKKLLLAYGEKGEKAFNAAFRPIIEQTIPKEIERLEAEFQEVLKRCPAGAPYDEREINQMLAGNPNYTDFEGIDASRDHRRISSLKASYRFFFNLI